MEKKITIMEVVAKYQKLSLKRICDECKVCYQYVLKKSKEPIKGEVYDPTKVNFEAIAKSFEKVDLGAIDWETIEASMKTFEPINAIEDFEIASEFKMRGSDEVMSVLLKTPTHIVFMGVASTQPRVMNNDTFLHQSPRIINKVEKEEVKA